MPIEFHCTQCSQLLRVPDDSAGKSARCPKCQNLMMVPAASSAANPAVPKPLPSPLSPSNPSESPFATTSTSPFEPKPSGNPFSEGQPQSPFGGPAVGSVNPYASPASTAYGYQPPTPGSRYARTGLPWEVEGAGFGSWWETTKMVMTQTPYAFSVMRQSGGFGNPILFALWGQGVGYVAQLVWVVLFLGFAILAGANAGRNELVAQLVVQVAFGAVGAVAAATIGVFIGAAIQHLALKIVGGAYQQYETSFRVMAFVNGSFAWLNIIPICGPFVAAIWLIVAGIIGMAHAHECSTGKAIGAFFVALLLVCAIIVVIYVGILAVVFAVVGAAGLAR